MKFSVGIFIFFTTLFLVSCNNKQLPNQEMIDLLKATDRYEDNPMNAFSPETVVRFSDSIIAARPRGMDLMPVKLRKGNALLEIGEEQKAIEVFEAMLAALSPMEFETRLIIKKDLYSEVMFIIKTKF